MMRPSELELATCLSALSPAYIIGLLRIIRIFLQIALQIKQLNQKIHMVVGLSNLQIYSQVDVLLIKDPILQCLVMSTVKHLV